MRGVWGHLAWAAAARMQPRARPRRQLLRCALTAPLICDLLTPTPTPTPTADPHPHPDHPHPQSHPRGAPPPPPRIPDEVLASDPDNIPPNSRLFIVVPKAAEARVIEDEVTGMSDGLEYIKTDLIASKGVVFVKYGRASAALHVLEDVGAKVGRPWTGPWCRRAPASSSLVPSKPPPRT
jgi:hypothetical protein